MRISSVTSNTTGRKIPNGWEPSLNPHSDEHPPHTQGISAIISGCSAFTSKRFTPCFNSSVTSKVNVVRPMGWRPKSFPFTVMVAYVPTPSKRRKYRFPDFTSAVKSFTYIAVPCRFPCVNWRYP